MVTSVYKYIQTLIIPGVLGIPVKEEVSLQPVCLMAFLEVDVYDEVQEPVPGVAVDKQRKGMNRAKIGAVITSISLGIWDAELRHNEDGQYHGQAGQDGESRGRDRWHGLELMVLLIKCQALATEVARSVK